MNADVDSAVAVKPGTASTSAPVPVVAVERPAPAEVAGRTPQDWELLVSEGHVRGHRLLEVGKTLFWPALAAGLFGGWLVVSGMTGGILTRAMGGGSSMPDFITRYLVWDPNTYASVPGRTERAPFQFAWLEGAAGSPQRGLSAQAWAQLLNAATKDVRASGDKVAEWTAIPAATDLNPKVTRPDKALTEFKGDLERGIIAIPNAPVPATGIGGGTNALAYVAAWVEGKFSFALLAAPPPNVRYGAADVPCYVVFEATPGCQVSPYAGHEVTRLQPQGGR